MERDFAVEDTTTLIRKNERFDLHNDYFLRNVKLDKERTNLVLIWERGEERWTDVTLPVTIYLLFERIQFLEMSDELIRKNYGEEFYIEEMGYLSEKHVLADALIEEEEATDSMHLFFRFDTSGWYIRVLSEEAKILVIEEE